MSRPSAGPLWNQRADLANAKPCSTEECGHRCDEHRELPQTHPDYRPLRFACTHKGCGCQTFTALPDKQAA